MPRDLDLGSGPMVHRRASLIDLYLHYTPNLIQIGETFCGRMDGETVRPALLALIVIIIITITIESHIVSMGT